MTVDISSEIFDAGLRQTVMNIVDFLKFQDFSRLMLVYDSKWVFFDINYLVRPSGPEYSVNHTVQGLTVHFFSFKYDALELFMPLLQEYSAITTFRPISTSTAFSVLNSIHDSFDYMQTNQELFMLIFAENGLTEK